MSLAQTAGDEAKAAMRAQADRFVADMDLVRREEIDALKAEIAALREEIAALKGAPKAAKAKPDADA
jgi:BMFP domain-containing protein YqiC